MMCATPRRSTGDPVLDDLRRQATQMKGPRRREAFRLPPGRKVFAQVYASKLDGMRAYPWQVRARAGSLLRPDCLWLDTCPWPNVIEVGDTVPVSGTTEATRWA